MGQNGGDWAQ
jgi:hypothetical protein